MSAPKIAIYAMAKNEIAHVPRFVQNIYGADHVVVTDTGSTDGTQDKLREAGIEVRDAAIKPWRFDTGTNVALANVPADIDICVKLDLDEVLWTTDGSPWRTEIDQAWQTKPFTQFRYWYTWSWHRTGEIPSVRFRQGHIHHRDGFIWKHPGHAALTAPKDNHVFSGKILEIHHYIVKKDRPNYMPLLQLAVEENRCPRTLFYLAREHFFSRNWVDAINMLQDYLEHPDARWNAERAEAMRMQGVCWRYVGDNNRAVASLISATAEKPRVRELWFELLRHFVHVTDFHGAYWAGIKCLSLVNRCGDYNAPVPDAWNESPQVLTGQAAYALGKHEEAKALVEQAIEINPHSKEARELAINMGIGQGVLA